MIDVLLCFVVGLVGFFSSYGVWQAAMEKRIVRAPPPKRSARVDSERKAERRTSHRAARPKLSRSRA